MAGLFVFQCYLEYLLGSSPISVDIYKVEMDYPRFGRHLALFAPDLFKRLRGHSIKV